jgi:hypothetical protein
MIASKTSILLRNPRMPSGIIPHEIFLILNVGSSVEGWVIRWNFA